MIYSKNAIDYNNSMRLGCYVEDYEFSIIKMYIWKLRFSMYGGLI